VWAGLNKRPVRLILPREILRSKNHEVAFHRDKPNRSFSEREEQIWFSGGRNKEIGLVAQFAAN
jgi:hypothetical protein